MPMPSKQSVRFIFNNGDVRYVRLKKVPALVADGAGLPIAEPFLLAADILLETAVEKSIREMPGGMVNWRGSKPRDGRMYGPGEARS